MNRLDGFLVCNKYAAPRTLCQPVLYGAHFDVVGKRRVRQDVADPLPVGRPLELFTINQPQLDQCANRACGFDAQSSCCFNRALDVRVRVL